jgi:hypothetical protein
MNPWIPVLLGSLIVLSGCHRAPAAPSPGTEAASSAQAFPTITVYKNATCGCCEGWIEHLREAGFTVTAHDMDNLASVKERVGVPYGMGSCHTAEVDGYFIEGHVPAQDLKRLLVERPKAKGLVVPGMPIGSPGMEDPSGRVDAYAVMIIDTDGKPSVYARHGEGGRP